MTAARAKSMMFLMVLRIYWNLKDLDSTPRKAINVLASESEVKQTKSKGFLLPRLLYRLLSEGVARFKVGLGT